MVWGSTIAPTLRICRAVAVGAWRCSKWIEDISTTPAPIKYTLEEIEFAVTRVDPTKADCVKDAVARHIRDVYTCVVQGPTCLGRLAFPVSDAGVGTQLQCRRVGGGWVALLLFLGRATRGQICASRGLSAGPDPDMAHQ